MKTIRIARKGSEKPYRLENGDIYDSKLTVEDSNGREIYVSNRVNTDSTIGYKGGLLQTGIYYAIVGLHKGMYKALKLFRMVSPERLANIKTESDLTEAERTLPSAIPNPNHAGEFVIQLVNIHKGGSKWDWSHGCITIYIDDWNEFINCFDSNEVCKVLLTQSAVGGLK